MAATCVTLRHDATWFSYWDACALAERIATSNYASLVVLDLGQTTETTTAALARLIAIRRDLLKDGRDLRIAGLTGRAYELYRIAGLPGARPRAKCPKGSGTSRRVA